MRLPTLHMTFLLLFEDAAKEETRESRRMLLKVAFAERIKQYSYGLRLLLFLHNIVQIA